MAVDHLYVEEGAEFPEFIAGHRVEFEQSDGFVGAWSPDLPGCIAVGTSSEIRAMFREGVEMHTGADGDE